MKKTNIEIDCEDAMSVYIANKVINDISEYHKVLFAVDISDERMNSPFSIIDTNNIYKEIYIVTIDYDKEIRYEYNDDGDNYIFIVKFVSMWKHMRLLINGAYEAIRAELTKNAKNRLLYGDPGEYIMPMDLAIKNMNPQYINIDKKIRRIINEKDNTKFKKLVYNLITEIRRLCNIYMIKSKEVITIIEDGISDTYILDYEVLSSSDNELWENIYNVLYRGDIEDIKPIINKIRDNIRRLTKGEGYGY